MSAPLVPVFIVLSIDSLLSSCRPIHRNGRTDVAAGVINAQIPAGTAANPVEPGHSVHADDPDFAGASASHAGHESTLHGSTCAVALPSPRASSISYSIELAMRWPRSMLQSAGTVMWKSTQW